MTARVRFLGLGLQVDVPVGARVLDASRAAGAPVRPGGLIIFQPILYKPGGQRPGASFPHFIHRAPHSNTGQPWRLLRPLIDAPLSRKKKPLYKHLGKRRAN